MKKRESGFVLELLLNNKVISGGSSFLKVLEKYDDMVFKGVLQVYNAEKDKMVTTKRR